MTMAMRDLVLVFIELFFCEGRSPNYCALSAMSKKNSFMSNSYFDVIIFATLFEGEGEGEGEGESDPETRRTKNFLLRRGFRLR